MPKDVLLYGVIDSYSAPEVIKEINEVVEADPEAEVIVRVNTPGGSPEYGWGIAAKLQSLKAGFVLYNDGQSHSMGMFLNCYAKKSFAVDTNEFLVHRAAYPMWYESDPDFMDEATRGNLERVNKSLRTAFENKVDGKKFEEITGVKIKDIFSMNGRAEVYLTAKQAKQIGLIDEIITLTPSKKSEIDALYEKAALRVNPKRSEEEKKDKNLPKIEAMTIEKLKAEHPELYASIFKAGETAGITAGTTSERERVNACLEFLDIDKEGALKIVKEGRNLNQADMAAFTVKSIKEAKKTALGKEGAASEIHTDEEEITTEVKTEEKKTLDEFLKNTRAELKKG
jgi:ATP-dependent protease ClpP protease subunit